MAPLTLVPILLPPDGTVYHLMVLPADVAFRFDEEPAQMELGLALTDVGAVGNASKVIATSSVLVPHVDIIVQRNVYVPAPPAGVNVEVGLEILLNCELFKLGPLTTDQLPLPMVGVFAASVAEEVTHNV